MDEEKTNVVLLGCKLIRQVSTRRRSTNKNPCEKVTKMDEEKTKGIVTKVRIDLESLDEEKRIQWKIVQKGHV